MKIKQIGLGKMGLGIAENLIRCGYESVGYDLDQDARDALVALGGQSVDSLDSLFQPDEQHIVFLMLPAGQITHEMIDTCLDYMKVGDILIDAGNSHYRQTLDHAEHCAAKGIEFIDIGTSGGVEGARNGACMMVGGTRQAVEQIEPCLLSLCVEHGYLHTGAVGSGHYLKMIHNGIEYGMMQAIGEGFNLLEHSPFDYEMQQVATVFNHGSVIRSWLMELVGEIFEDPDTLHKIAGVVPSSGEGKWTVEESLVLRQAAPVITQAVLTRYMSEDQEKYNEKLIARMRQAFGGHGVVTK